jgi:hypothetical protein
MTKGGERMDQYLLDAKKAWEEELEVERTQIISDIQSYDEKIAILRMKINIAENAMGLLGFNQEKREKFIEVRAQHFIDESNKLEAEEPLFKVEMQQKLRQIEALLQQLRK